MKKKYERPVFVFESFSLNTNIAGTCEVKTNTQGYGECGLDMSGVSIFIEGVSGCGINVPNLGGDGENQGLCYHVPQGENLFNS